MDTTKYIKREGEAGSDKPVDDHSQGVISGVGDLLRAAAYSGIQKPLEGTAQLINHVASTNLKPDLISAPKNENMWTTAGAMVGNVADFYVLSKAVGGARAGLIGRSATVPLLEAGTTGALFELTQPVNDNDFAGSKMKNAAIGFGTFATMDGASLGLRKLSWLKNSNSFMADVGISGVSGMAGGLTHSVLDAGLYNKPITLSDVGSDVASYGAFGAMFGGLDSGITRGSHALGEHFQSRIDQGKPLFSFGPIEVHPRGYSDMAKRMMDHDPLTGLRNKHGGEESLQMEVARSARDGDPLSMTYVDLDNFKLVNDRFGHKQGDNVLTRTADLLKQGFRRGTDVHVRDGGDEFMVIMPNTSIENASKVASRFEQNMRLGVSENGPDPLSLAQNLKPELNKLSSLPSTVPTRYGDTLTDVAATLITQRAPVTGETVTPFTVRAEVNRLQERTGLKNSSILGEGELQVYNQQDLVSLGDKVAFRFVPQTGQYLKLRGVATEEQIQEALSHQKGLSLGQRPLIGELLVKLGHATPEQIQSVLAEQMQLRAIAHSTIAEHFGQSTPNLAGNFARQLTPAEVTQLRTGIADVFRPQLDPTGIRVLQRFEPPAPQEVVVGASTGVVQYQKGEDSASFKKRGDELMFDKKAERKAQGLRHDRN